MKILINVSCNKGGGIQVCDGLIRTLGDFADHKFIVCATSEVMSSLGSGFEVPKNVVILPRPPQTMCQRLLSRYPAMDRIVSEQRAEAVFTVFGPSYWKPKVPHLCGFAISHYVFPESGFQRKRPWKKRLLVFLYKTVQMHSFKHHADALVVENPIIGDRLKTIYGVSEVYTAYNTCNPVFFDEKRWDRTISLPEFQGATILTLASYYPHKNLDILVPTARVLKKTYPAFRFRFVLSIKREQLNADLSEVEDAFIFLGSVPISRCPWLYKQADIMLLPTQLECFSASWAEAMVMGVPIITSDLPFAHGICEDAACYVDQDSPNKLAEAIFALSHSSERRQQLIDRGKIVRLKFADAHTRARKCLDIIEKMC